MLHLIIDDYFTPLSSFNRGILLIMNIPNQLNKNINITTTGIHLEPIFKSSDLIPFTRNMCTKYIPKLQILADKVNLPNKVSLKNEYILLIVLFSLKEKFLKNIKIPEAIIILNI